MIATFIAAASSSQVDPRVIEFDASGTFAPVIFLDTVAYPGAFAQWIVNEDVVATGTNPSIVLVGNATVGLRVTPWAALQTIILRHDGGDGGETTGVLDDLFPLHSSEALRDVTAIRNLEVVGGTLLGIAASGTHIAELDLHNCTALRRVELYSTYQLTSFRADQANLERICLEDSPIDGWRGDGALDGLSWTSLRDIRAAGCQFDQVLLPPGTLSQCLHICVRTQRLDLASLPQPGQCPAIREYWVSGNAYDGVFDLSGFGEERANVVSVWISDTQGLTGLTLGHHVHTLLAYDNPGISSSSVDAILSALVGFGLEGGTVDLHGTSVPSAAGLADIATLAARGWTVTVDS